MEQDANGENHRLQTPERNSRSRLRSVVHDRRSRVHRSRSSTQHNRRSRSQSRYRGNQELAQERVPDRDHVSERERESNDALPCERERDRHQRLREREKALAREQAWIREMQRDLQKERDEDNWRQRSEHRASRDDSTSRCRGRREPSRVRRESSRGRQEQSTRHREPSIGRRKPSHRSREPSRARREPSRGLREPSRGLRDTPSIAPQPKRSCSPSFSSKDVLQIIQSIKGGLTSHPSNQNAHSSKNLDFKNILPEFNPSSKTQRMDVWLKKVNECASVYGWDERTTIHFAMQKLQGLAKTWYESLNSILYSWQEWQTKLLNAFPWEQNYGQSLEEMLRRRSRFNESIESYYYEKLALINQCDITGKRAVDCIIHGISDKTMKSSALALTCVEPDQLLKFLSSNNREHFSQQPFKDRNSSSVEDKQGKTYNRQFNVGVFCYNCKEKGHPYMKCSKPIIKCDRCNRVGHKSDNCFTKPDVGLSKTNSVPKAMRISNSNTNDKFIKDVGVNGITLQAFVDFGSEVTLIRQSDFSKFGFQHDNTPSTMKGFGNGVVHSIGSVTLDLTVDGVKAAVPCRIVEDILLEKPMLIGQTFSEQAHIIVYKDANKLQFYDIGTEVSTVCVDDDDERLVRVSIGGHTSIYGTSSVRAKTELKFTGYVMLTTKVVGKPNQQFMVYGGIYRVQEGLLYVVITPCVVPCLLQENNVFSRAERIDVVHRVMSSTSKVSQESVLQRKLDESQVRIGSLVTDQDKARLLSLLQRYKHCFADSLGELGCTDVTQMKIELNSNRPVVYRPYRLSHHERERVRNMVDDMLEAGIIRESVSGYASPIILVRKKDGNMRLCVDYRMLNSVTIKERYPMPIIEDEIARLSGQAWFVTLDLMSGYYQVPISEDCKHLTAFVTPDGQYEYNRMPFGLANAPAVFQRMMNHVLGPARFNKATVYIDDLLVFGADPTQCLDRLEEVLHLLQEADLKLNLSKCCFLKNKIDYLGYEISSAGVKPGETKIKCVVDFPSPQNVHGVRQFLGLVSYFRKFIQGFALIACPLTKLLKKDAVWEWAGEQEEAFRTLKDKLVNRPILTIYNPTAEAELHTDASRLGVGAILLQRSRASSDQFRPVAYYSRQTTPEEKNFHSYELETLAVVCALKKFRVYLLGKEFKIITDCSALRSTFQKRDLIPRIARWWLILQEFDCSVEYRPGSKMLHVDALSRNPINDRDSQNPDLYPMVRVIAPEDWLLTLQLGDEELRKIRDVVVSNLNSKDLEYIKENYILKDNKLFRCLDGDKDKIRWVVPKGARWQLCRMNHDDIGHVGFEKTLERLKKNYWFAKMKRFVKKYVEACIECAYAKKTSNTREGLLHPIPKVAAPFHTLHVDHLGPFVKSKRGHTHILVVVDSFTKFVFIKSVRNTNTQNVIRVLEEIFFTFKAPERLVSDRGSCFTSHSFRKFCLDKGIKHILNAVSSPRSNGQVERYNRTILDALTAQNLGDCDKDWDSKLGRIQWGLNNTVQKTTAKTPAEVMFGMSMNGEINASLSEITNETQETRDLLSLRQEVKERIDKAQESQKAYYDKGRQPAHEYNVGDLVKITKVTFHNEGKSTKLMPSYEGPYRVAKVLGNDRYKIAPIPGYEGMRNKRRTTVAADRMKPWIHLAALGVDDAMDDQSDVDMSSARIDGIVSWPAYRMVN